MSDSRVNPAAKIDSKPIVEGFSTKVLGNIKGALPSANSQEGCVNPNPMKGMEFPEAGRQDAPSGIRRDGPAETFRDKKRRWEGTSGGNNEVNQY